MSTPTQDGAGLSIELRHAKARIEELERQVEAGLEAESRYQILYEAGR